MSNPGKTKQDKRYGRLVTLKRTHRMIGKNPPKRDLYWVCRCDCGMVKTIRSCALSSGFTRSCGCLHIESSRKNRKKATAAWRQHGESVRKTRIYKLWRGMRGRCSSNRYEVRIYYKDRGISLCSLWEKDYLEFKRWAKANGYRAGLQIDRIDGGKGYSPDNCRFVTPKQQANNRRPQRPHGSVNVRARRGKMITGKVKPKLSWVEIQIIKRLRGPDHKRLERSSSLKALAKRFNCSITTVHFAAKGRYDAHFEGQDAAKTSGTEKGKAEDGYCRSYRQRQNIQRAVIGKRIDRRLGQNCGH